MLKIAKIIIKMSLWLLPTISRRKRGLKRMARAEVARGVDEEEAVVRKKVRAIKPARATVL